MPLTSCREGRDRGETRSASRETCQQDVMKRADGVIRDRNGPDAAAWGTVFRNGCPFRRKERPRMPRTTLFVCMTCKAGQPVPEGTLPPGARLHAALMAGDAPDGIAIVPVECLSACSQGCTVALSKPGAWGYVYGRLGPEHAADILDGAARYAASEAGIVPWRERPEIFRKQSIARIPPLGASPATLTPTASRVSE